MVNIFNRFLKKEKNLEEPEKNNMITYVPIGSSGTTIYSGYIYEDYLNDMTGSGRSEIYDKMAISDYNVIMCLNAVCNPIKSATWEIIAGEDSDEANSDADLIRHILFHDMEKPFDSFLTEALSFVTFGFSVFEIIHKVVNNHPEFKNYIGIKNLAWRSQKTIEKWNVDPVTENLISVGQTCYGDVSRNINIPSEFLLLFNNNAKGSNFEGVSFLRACYGNWKRKNMYLKLNAAGIEKFSIPTPTVEVPTGKENSVEFTNLVNVLQSYTSHQQNYLTYPTGWKIELNANNGFDPSKVEISIDSEDKRMTKAFLANFLELGMNGTGAYALSNDLSDFFLGGIQHIANEICKKINSKLIPSLIKLNRGEKNTYPQLTVSNIADKAGTELATILATAVNSNIIIPDDQLEDHFRNRFKLPARSDEGQRTKAPIIPNAFSLTDKVIKALRGNKNAKK